MRKRTATGATLRPAAQTSADQGRGRPSMSVRVAAVFAMVSVSLVGTGHSAQAEEAWQPRPSYTSTDSGAGTYSVPVLNSDVPDVSVERVPAAQNDEGRDIYYMISTTMHLSPGAPIMKSYDLVNWEIVNYVYDRISINDSPSLRNGANSYGQGQWASSLRYHDGTFYVVFNTNNLGGAYIYRTDDIENGAWTRTSLGRGLHDPSLYFDDADGGTPYIFYGSGGVSAVRLNEDLTQIVAEYPSIFTASNYAGQPFIGGLFEGAQVYRIGDYYYVAIITWPSGQNRQQVIFRSPHLLGRYAAPGGVNTYEARSALNSDGFAQGSLVEVVDDTGESNWHGFFFRDTFPIGRIPAMIPAVWNDGWPTFGDNGVVTRGSSFDHVIELSPEEARFERQKAIVASDDFDNDAPHKAYMDEVWTLPEPPDYDESLLGVELLENPGFEAGSLAPWAPQFGATLALDTTDPAGGTTALRVSNRTLNGSGPNQFLTGKVQAGVTYTVSAKVKYTSGPSTVRFNLVADFGSGVQTMAFATVPLGEWTTISGRYTMPSNANVSSFKFAVETPWANPQPPSSTVEYLLDDVSFVGEPVTTEYPSAAEVEPNGSRLDMAWQWNHTPDNRYWSLTDREGWLRLTTGKVVTGDYVYTKLSGRDELTYFEEARNTLSQRTFGPKASAETKLDISGMKDGDVAGIAAYTRSFSYAAVRRIDGENVLGIVQRLQPFTATIDQAALESFVPGSTVDLGSATEVYLKADADFATNNGQLWLRYYYSLDGATWSQLGTGRSGPLTMDWSLSHFMGYRFGLFNYATEQVGGHVDFDYYYLSDTLTADNAPLDASDLDAAIAHAATLDESDYPAESWNAMQAALAKAEAARESSPTTQNQIDAPERALSYQLAKLGVEKAAVPSLDISVVAGTRCVAGRVMVTVQVSNDDAVPVSVEIDSAYGSRSFASVEPGKNAFHAFTTREASVPAGSVSIKASATVDGHEVTVPVEAAYGANSCG